MLSTPQTHCTVDLQLDRKQAPSSSVSRYQPLLDDLLTSSIVLTEDFEKLAAQTQDEIRQCSETQKLLPLLVQHGLLTEYQANRVEAGTTYGLILGNYRVLDRLGAGGMGVVFKAEHVVMRRPVAIKVLSSFADQDHPAIGPDRRAARARWRTVFARRLRAAR